jgi:hypothetical protein
VEGFQGHIRRSPQGGEGAEHRESNRIGTGDHSGKWPSRAKIPKSSRCRRLPPPPDGLLPLVLSIVIYNGKARWLAPQELAELIRGIDGPLAAFIPRFWYLLLEMEACEEAELEGPNLVALLIRLERGRSREELERIIGDLVAALPGPDEGGVRRAFVVWIRRVLLAGRAEEEIPELVNLEEFRTMLLESVEEWNKEIEARGEEKGLRVALSHQLEVKFGDLDDRTRAQVAAGDPQHLMEWIERVLTAERLADVFGH